MSQTVRNDVRLRLAKKEFSGKPAMTLNYKKGSERNGQNDMKLQRRMTAKQFCFLSIYNSV